MKTRVMFIASSIFALGESIIAQAFARRLPAEDFEASFVISQNAKELFEGGDWPYFMLIGGQDVLNRVLLEEFIQVREPDLIILADYYTLAHSNSCFGISIDYLRHFGRPILSFDIYEWEESDFQVDFFDGRIKQMSRGIADLPGLLRPCPLNRVASPSGRHYPYSLFDPQAFKPPAPRSELRAKHHIPSGRKVIFMATAGWQSWLYRDHKERRFGDDLPKIYSLILNGVGGKLEILHVGPERLHLEAPGLSYHHHPILCPDRFNEMLALSDLYLTNNIVATTLAKAVHFGIPAVMLSNSYVFTGAEGLDQIKDFQVSDPIREIVKKTGRVFAYKMCPLGWHAFISRLLRDNPYTRTFTDLEVLDVMTCRRAIRHLLFEEEVRRQMIDLQSQYVQALDTLATPGQILGTFGAGTP
jgi:hypothetical protein